MGYQIMKPVTHMNDAQPFEICLASFFDLAVETAACANRMKSVSDFADALELTTEFKEVVQTTAALERTEALRHWITGEGRHAVGTFLRRSGVYLSLYAGERPSVTDVAGRLRELLLQSHVNVTYLAPIELIQLSRDQLTLEQFSIRRFNRSELAAMTENHIREAFYPWATLDLEFIEDYWFLVASDTIPVRSSFDLTDIFDSRVSPFYTGYPKAIEKSLYPLALYDWVDVFHPSNSGIRPVKRAADDGPLYPRFPFVVTLSEYWLKAPEPAPETKEMVRDPHFNNAGEEAGDSPYIAFDFDEMKTKKLEEDLGEFVARLHLIEQHQPEWRFVYTALGFLTKALQAEGLEQLLWHVTAIEAVLGQNLDTGLTKTLKRRIAEVFGRSVDEKKRFKKQFDDLYGFRSDLVHGNAELSDRKIMKGHLAESRDFARGVIAWATGFLAHVARNYPFETQPIPTREYLLLILDMETSSRSAVSTLLQSLPTGFPPIENWLIYEESAGFPWGS
jgi:hypothetical protein